MQYEVQCVHHEGSAQSDRAHSHVPRHCISMESSVSMHILLFQSSVRPLLSGVCSTILAMPSVQCPCRLHSQESPTPDNASAIAVREARRAFGMTGFGYRSEILSRRAGIQRTKAGRSRLARLEGSIGFNKGMNDSYSDDEMSPI